MASVDRIESPPGYPGMQGSRRIQGGIRTLLNAANEVAQVSTVTIGTVAANTVYRIAIDGELVTYTATATDTAATVIAELVEKINLGGYGVKAVAGATTFTLTGYAGQVVDITGSGGTGFAIALTTPAAESSPIRFGRAIVQLPTDAMDVGRLPSANDQKFVGITLASQKEQEKSGVTHYRNTEPMPVMRQGSVWVELETEGNEVYVRHAVDGSFTELGRISGVSGTGLVKLEGAEIIYRQGAIAEVSLSGLEKFEVVGP